ncbi:MAG: hypothetical protein ACKV1O_30650 [Saprospiraceae bacterium]
MKNSSPPTPAPSEHLNGQFVVQPNPIEDNSFIFNAPPSFTLRWGNIIILLLLVSFFGASWFLKYPEMVSAPFYPVTPTQNQHTDPASETTSSSSAPFSEPLVIEGKISGVWVTQLQPDMTILLRSPDARLQFHGVLRQIVVSQDKQSGQVYIQLTDGADILNHIYQDETFSIDITLSTDWILHRIFRKIMSTF